MWNEAPPERQRDVTERADGPSRRSLIQRERERERERERARHTAVLVGHKQQRVIERQRLKINNVLVGRTARLKL